jgi:hypothetical protein
VADTVIEAAGAHAERITTLLDAQFLIMSAHEPTTAQRISLRTPYG